MERYRLIKVRAARNPLNALVLRTTHTCTDLPAEGGGFGMYGHIHIILKDLVLEAFGQNVWSAILLRAGLEEDVVLNTVQHPDEVSYRLVAATCAETELSAEDALEAFGRHFVGFALRTGNARFLKAQGSTLPGFLANVNTLHNQLERDHPNALRTNDFSFAQQHSL
ncbi:Guanylate cyclase soluble subunit beta-1 [Symbiodinium microadriaticum]|uniref:Guanylate cyclase soluble subunit beta-1 n=1 Tax=Symbiodinium microadriaticum TaxID=2951 RepID=A0A1Q9EQW4_SYMMI|nr:Guanylate cyclase soluble subunit beta-1 [Symbiodinium microadriaticum]